MDEFYKLTENEIMALVLYGEARGESVEGKLAVAHVVMNRVNADLGADDKPDWWGEGVHGVILRKWQFSCFNASDPNYRILSAMARSRKLNPTCMAVAELVVGGHTLDPTHGATHYHEQSVKPSWLGSPKMRLLCHIGRHRFYREG